MGFEFRKPGRDLRPNLAPHPELPLPDNEQILRFFQKFGQLFLAARAAAEPSRAAGELPRARRASRAPPRQRGVPLRTEVLRGDLWESFRSPQKRSQPRSEKSCFSQHPKCGVLVFTRHLRTPHHTRTSPLTSHLTSHISSPYLSTLGSHLSHTSLLVPLPLPRVAFPTSDFSPLSSLTSHLSLPTSLISPRTSHLSSHLSPLTSHLSHLTSHL